MWGRPACKHIESMESKKRLKILFIAALYPTAQEPVRGIFVREHAKAVAMYNDVRVISFADSSISLTSLYEISESVEEGIKTFRIRSKKSPIPKMKRFMRWWAVTQLFRNMRQEGWQPDVLHAHFYSAGVPAVLLGRHYRIPVVISEHWSGFARQKLGRFKKALARFSMNRASIVLPVSEDLIGHIQFYGIRNKFRAVPNVVDTEIFYPSLDRNPTKAEPKKILTVALLSPIKGIPFLLQALAQIKQRRQDFCLDIVGDGPNRAEYEAMVADLGLEGYVAFHGLQPKQEVARFMRCCDFFVLPSLWETFGVVLVESMASGKPVVATDVGAVSELVNGEVGLLVTSADADALGNGIEHMLNHCKSYHPEKIADYARENFSYGAVGKLLDQIYRESCQK